MARSPHPQFREESQWCALICYHVTTCWFIRLISRLRSTCRCMGESSIRMQTVNSGSNLQLRVAKLFRQPLATPWKVSITLPRPLHYKRKPAYDNCINSGCTPTVHMSTHLKGLVQTHPSQNNSNRIPLSSRTCREITQTSHWDSFRMNSHSRTVTIWQSFLAQHTTC